MGKRKAATETTPDLPRVDHVNMILQRAGGSMYATDIQAAMKSKTRIRHEICTLVDQGHVIRLGKDLTGKMRYIHATVADLKPKRACTHCGEEKPVTSEFFHLKEHATNTYHGVCKLCRLEILRARRQTASEQRMNERAIHSGRIEETQTQGGRVVRFGKQWKPARDGQRNRDGGLPGYESSLARI